mmetsp:Transcript_28169/g.87155  ORF Transcript_28169/g.87155 Transcript_28169/m.87155 type:complete len:219 (+) Transcript_28169:209-865(+)
MAQESTPLKSTAAVKWSPRRQAISVGFALALAGLVGAVSINTRAPAALYVADPPATPAAPHSTNSTNATHCCSIQGVLCGSWHDASTEEEGDDLTLDDSGISACIHAAQDEKTCNNCNPDNISLYDDTPNPQWIVIPPNCSQCVENPDKYGECHTATWRGEGPPYDFCRPAGAVVTDGDGPGPGNSDLDVACKGSCPTCDPDTDPDCEFILVFEGPRP